MNDWKMNGKPALLIMHMQPSMREREAKILEETGIIPRQQALLKAFRRKKLPVIYVYIRHGFPLHGSLQIPAYGRIWQEYRKSAFEETPKNLEFLPELTPQPGEPVLISWPFGAFNNSGLDQALKVCGAETLVMFGFASYGGLYSALQAAADRYHSIIIPKDASAAPSSEANEVFMEYMAPEVALVTTTDDVIAHL